MTRTLSGKVVLITGGSRDFGAFLAETLADQGADIAISYVASAARAEAEAVVEKLKAKGVRAIAVQGNLVADPTLDATAYDRQWMVNVLGSVTITRAAAQKISDGGRIVFIGSGQATRAIVPGVADYAGTKAAISGYARGVQRDLGRRNITVNVVQAGIMATEMAAEAAENFPQAVIDMHPISRIATLEEVAGAVSYLVGPNAAYTAGTIIDVSGGVLV